MSLTSTPICALYSPDGTSPTGYKCTLPMGHTGDHEAHGLGPGNVQARWSRRMDGALERECAAELAAADAAEHAALRRGDSDPEEVDARRKGMRVLG